MSNAAQIIGLIAALILTSAVAAAGPAPVSPLPTDVAALGEPPASEGAALFARHCTMCHQPAALGRGIQRAPDPDAAKAAMLGWLSRHGQADAAADAAIVDYLGRL